MAKKFLPWSKGSRLGSLESTVDAILLRGYRCEGLRWKSMTRRKEDVNVDQNTLWHGPGGPTHLCLPHNPVGSRRADNITVRVRTEILLPQDRPNIIVVLA